MFIMFNAVILSVLFAEVFSQDINLPMKTYKAEFQSHFLAPEWSAKRVSVPIPEMVDGNLNTCALTRQGKNWIFLMSADSKRLLPTSFTVKMKHEAGKRYMVNPKVYMTDMMVSESLPELKEPQFRRCHQTYFGITPDQHEVTLSCKGQAGTYALIEYGNADSISICEIQVAGKYDTNLALRKPVGMNVQAFGGAAPELAVDGSGDIANYALGRCAAGHNHVHPYLWVNLGEVVDIEMVKIVNRADYGPERLNGLALYIKNTQPSNDPAYFNSGKCNCLFGQAEGGTYAFPCFGRGAYVVARINTPQPTYLTICELEVYLAPPLGFNTVQKQGNAARRKIVTAVQGSIANIHLLTDGSYENTAALTYDSNKIKFKIDLTIEHIINNVRIFSTKSIPGVKIFTSATSECVKDAPNAGAPNFTEHKCTNPGPITGRYLFVEFSDPGNGAALAEVEIFGTVAPMAGLSDDGTDFALNKLINVVHGSVTNKQYLTDGNISPPGPTFTYIDRENIFAIDLGGAYHVKIVRIYATGEIRNVKIYSDRAECFNHAIVTALPHFGRFACRQDMMDRMVFIKHEDPGNGAVITEVGVYNPGGLSFSLDNLHI